MGTSGPVKLNQVVRAFEILGGEAEWPAILNEVTKLRGGDKSYYLDELNYKNTTFQVIQKHCPGYAKYQGPPRFERVRRNRFRLLSGSAQYSKPLLVAKSTPIAHDIKEPSQPERIKQETYRILRDTELARMVKASYSYHCQVCGEVLLIGEEIPYAEAHHVKPLGAPHNGPDRLDNILCVCPNDHVLLDYGAIQLDAEQFKSIATEYIDYHNTHIFGNEATKIDT